MPADTESPASEANPLLQAMRGLIPLDRLSQQQLEGLLDGAEMLSVKKRERIFAEGDRDDYAFYLMEGELDLFSNEQLTKRVVAGTDGARYPLAQLQPRQLTAIARTAARV